MSRGGYRVGAGRKKGFAAKNAEEARMFFSKRVAEEIGPISDILILNAKKGDIRAIRELFDRAWGKAPQTTKIDANAGRPIQIVFDSAFDESAQEAIAQKQK